MSTATTPLAIVQRKRKETNTYVWYIDDSSLGQRIRLSLGTEDEKEAVALCREKAPGLIQKIKAKQFKSDSLAGIAKDYIASGKDERFISDLVKAFGPRPLNTITDSDVIQYANARPWTASTKNRQAIVPFNAIANWGASLSPPRCMPRNVPKFQFRKTPVQHAPEPWIYQVLRLAESEGAERLAACVTFLTVTSCRISEACRIVKDDIDVERGRVLIRRTKSGHSRIVNITPEFAEKLATLPDDQIFGYASRHSFATALRRLCARHSIPFYSSHKLGRHAFAARMAANGASLQMLRDAGGWASMTVVSDNYAHLEVSHVREAQLAQARLFEQGRAQRAVPSPLASPASEITKETDT